MLYANMFLSLALLCTVRAYTSTGMRAHTRVHMCAECVQSATIRHSVMDNQALDCFEYVNGHVLILLIVVWRGVLGGACANASVRTCYMRACARARI